LIWGGSLISVGGEEAMKVIIPGGSGQVGTILARAFHQAGHEVVILSRMPTKAVWRVMEWDARTLGDWTTVIEGADVVINLAGHNVNCRYNAQNRRLIKESRVESARVLGDAIARASRPPSVWLQASTATIYAHRYDAPNDEATGVLGGSEPDAPDTWRFSIDVATAWESELNESATPYTRKVIMRSAITMSPDRGGVFDTLLTLAKCGLGGSAGDGRQYVSWIHDQDFVRAVYWLIKRDDLEGPINIAAPNPIPNSEFMSALRSAAGLSFGLPATSLMLEVGAFFLRTESELVLKSRRVTPGKLLQSKFTFQFPTWAEAAQDLCNRRREAD
jgi:uncharacterized protein